MNPYEAEWASDKYSMAFFFCLVFGNLLAFIVIILALVFSKIIFVALIVPIAMIGFAIWSYEKSEAILREIAAANLRSRYMLEVTPKDSHLTFVQTTSPPLRSRRSKRKTRQGTY